MKKLETQTGFAHFSPTSSNVGNNFNAFNNLNPSITVKPLFFIEKKDGTMLVISS